MLQLQQFLAERFDLQSAVTGKCLLADTNGVKNNEWACDPPAMCELLPKDEKIAANMLMTLRSMGKMLNGFAVEMRADKLTIRLIYEE